MEITREVSTPNELRSDKSIVKTPAEVRTLDMKTGRGEFLVKSLDSRERFILALKLLGIFWGIALLWIPIPMVHFVTIPIFVLVGIIAFIRGITTFRRIEKGWCDCPYCLQTVKFKRLRYHADFKEKCSHCRQDIYIKLSAGNAAASAT